MIAHQTERTTAWPSKSTIKRLTTMINSEKKTGHHKDKWARSLASMTVSGHLGDRSFPAAIPRVWNTLPSQLRSDITTDISSMHWKDKHLSYNQPRRIVTNLLSCAYLLRWPGVFFSWSEQNSPSPSDMICIVSWWRQDKSNSKK